MRLRITTSLAVFALLSVACAPDETAPWKPQQKGSADFYKMLLRGKAPSHNQGLSGSAGFSLTTASSMATTTVDPATGRLGTAHFDTSRMPDVDRSQLKEYALSYINEHNALFGIKIDELREGEDFLVEDHLKNVTLQFDRYYKGIAVDNARLRVVFAPFAGQYRLREILNDAYGDIDIPVDQMLAMNEQSLRDKMGMQNLEENARKPVIYVVTNSQGLYEYSLAERVVMRDPETDEKFTVTVNRQGDILEAFSSHYHAQAFVEMWTQSQAVGKKVNVPIWYAKIGSVETDKDGKGSIPSGSVTVDWSAKVAGSRAYLGSTAYNLQFTMNGESTVVPMPSETLLAAANGYLRVNEIADEVLHHLSPSQSTRATKPIRVNVNLSQTCNAYYDGSSINFFKAGGGCANTGTMMDVVMHEWGHGLDDDLGGISDGAFSEGIGDILSFFKTHNSVLAPGFFTNKPTSGIRNAQNTKKYPGDVRGEVHADGEIISGAFWDMFKAMKERYGEKEGTFMTAKIFYNHLLTTSSYKKSYDAVIRLDDDDNNPSTKSPNHCLITQAFANHGLATAESNCEDAGVVPGDESLFLALRSAANNTVTLWASSDSKSSAVAVCLGDRGTCVKSKKADVVFTPHRKTADGIQIYKSDTSVELTSGKVVTMLSMDASGNVRAARQVKFTNMTGGGTTPPAGGGTGPQ